MAREMKIQEERETEFQNKKTEIELKVIKLREEIRILQEDESKMYREHMNKYER